MSKKKKIYYLESTDLFCGEANYTYLNRYLVKASSPLGAINVFSKLTRFNWRLHYSDGLITEYWTISKLTVCFIEEYDETMHHIGENIPSEITKLNF